MKGVSVRVKGVVFRVLGSGCWGPGLGFGFRVLGFRVWGLGLTSRPSAASIGNVKRFRGGLVFKAHRLLYHSTLGLRVIKRKRIGGDLPSLRSVILILRLFGGWGFGFWVWVPPPPSRAYSEFGVYQGCRV